MILKLLKTFFHLHQENILGYVFSTNSTPSSKLVNSLANLPCSLSPSSNDKYPSFICLKKAIGKEYSLKLQVFHGLDL